MKIRISQRQKDEITVARQALAREHTKLVGSIQGLGKLERRAEELPSEIADLEGGDASDKRVRAELADKRAELSMVQRQIEDLNHQSKTTGSPEHSRASNRVQDAKIAIERALRPVLEARLVEAIEVVRPLFNDEAAARAAAQQTPFYIQFCFYCVRPGTTEIHPLNVKQFIDLCDEVLAGELKFEFNPNI